MELAVKFPATLYPREPHLPGPVCEHDDVGTEPGRRDYGVVAGGNCVNAPVEGVLGAGAEFGAGLLIILTIAFDKAGLEHGGVVDVLAAPGLEGFDDHEGSLVEAPSRLVHADAEGVEFTAGQTTTHPQAEPTIAQQVEDHSVLCNPHRVVPG